MRVLFLIALFSSLYIHSFSQGWQVIYNEDFEGEFFDFSSSNSFNFIADIQEIPTNNDPLVVIQTDGFESSVLGPFSLNETLNFNYSIDNIYDNECLWAQELQELL